MRQVSEQKVCACGVILSLANQGSFIWVKDRDLASWNMDLIYAAFLRVLYPTSLSVLLLLTAVMLWRFNREKLARSFVWAAITVLLVCGNGWVARYSTRHLERQYPVLGAERAPASELGITNAKPIADCIVVLSGGTQNQISPRPSIEVSDAGDRVLYAAQLFHRREAPQVICSGSISAGRVAMRPAAEDIAELLVRLGVPSADITLETRSQNTHDHAIYLEPLLREKGYKRVIVVTSAAHMPRSMAVFKRACPGIEFIPAPTDFRMIDMSRPWYRQLGALVPTPANLEQFCETMHEYAGMLWYRLRGWA